MGRPAGEAWDEEMMTSKYQLIGTGFSPNTWFASTCKGPHSVSADCVRATVMGKVAISALVNIHTALVGLMVAIS